MKEAPRTLPTSARLTFRTWHADDLPLATKLWGDPRVTALIDARGALDRAAVAERLEREIELQNTCRIQYWPFFVGGELAGCAGLRPREIDRGVYEIGFHLCADFWGRGLAFEAGAAVVRFAFEELGASALFAGHHPENAASARVLAKLGFVHTHDELYPPTGLMHPSYRLERNR